MNFHKGFKIIVNTIGIVILGFFLGVAALVVNYIYEENKPKQYDFSSIKESQEDRIRLQQRLKSDSYLAQDDLTDEEYRNIKDGFADGFFDGEDPNLELKKSYSEPEAEDHLRDMYFYGYLGGYMTGCEEIESTRDDCKKVYGIIEDLKNPEEEPVQIDNNLNMDNVV